MLFDPNFDTLISVCKGALPYSAFYTHLEITRACRSFGKATARNFIVKFVANCSNRITSTPFTVAKTKCNLSGLSKIELHSSHVKKCLKTSQITFIVSEKFRKCYSSGFSIGTFTNTVESRRCFETNKINILSFGNKECHNSGLYPRTWDGLIRDNSCIKTGIRFFTTESFKKCDNSIIDIGIKQYYNTTKTCRTMNTLVWTNEAFKKCSYIVEAESHKFEAVAKTCKVYPVPVTLGNKICNSPIFGTVLLNYGRLMGGRQKIVTIRDSGRMFGRTIPK